MFPVIDLGPFAIQAPGLILILSLWIGFWMMGKFSHALGTNSEGIENSLLTGFVVGILGARIGFLLQQPAVFLENPLSLFSLTLSMMNVSFGLLSGLLGIFIQAQKKYLPLWPTLDSLVPLLTFIFIGWHLANFANGDAYGLPTELPWGVDLWNATRHPVQVYALILTICLLTWLIIHTRWFKTTGFLRSGLLFQWMVVGLAVITLITQSFVQDKMMIAGIDFIQVISFLILIGDLALIYRRRYIPRKRISVFISLGSNLNPMENLSDAIDALKNSYTIKAQSNIYQSQDVTQKAEAPTFHNQVIVIITNDDFTQLRKRIKSIEDELGRDRKDKRRVTIDLDVLTYNEDVFTYQGVKIPHPSLTKYIYLTKPLAEISSDFRHPATGESIQDIISKINDDQSAIKKIER
ncbi:MAG: 2-amino-4-hydroxy-6-hydroxymethyldihydropteridine diphosphokinase [Chloroflexota bacterium]|jgi:phosphatidylglycerol:prolipoprotein diacylglycerol transferase|nr:2-amino-4-hydroxy-6-hydroxymethyldihydropteridine diphosphokinase [Chloroflexota bacterium]